MYNFNELAERQGLRLLSYTEWLASAFGSPQAENGANNYAWAKTTNSAKTFTGCQVNTSTGAFDNVSGVKPYAISAKNIVDCVGNVYEWTKDNSLDFGSTSWNWQNVLPSPRCTSKIQGVIFCPFVNISNTVNNIFRRYCVWFYSRHIVEGSSRGVDLASCECFR